MHRLTDIDEHQAQAVETRQEIDLRTGAVFTRLLTLHYRPRLSAQLKDKIISYGSCQFPTLGFVVEQYLKRQNFVPEDFWYLTLTLAKEGKEVEFAWRRGHLFDPLVTLIFYEQTMAVPRATISFVNTKPITKRQACVGCL